MYNSRENINTMLTKITIENYQAINNKISLKVCNRFNIFTCNYDKVENSIFSLIKLFYKILTIGGSIKDSDIKEDTFIEYEFILNETTYTLTIKNQSFKSSVIESINIPYTNCIDSTQPVHRMMYNIRFRSAYLNMDDIDKIEGLEESAFHTDYHNYIIQNLMEHVLLLRENTALLINQLDHIHPELLVRCIPKIVQIAKNKNIILYIFSNSSYVLNIFRLLIKEEKISKENFIINDIRSELNMVDIDNYTTVDNISIDINGKLTMIKNEKTHAPSKSFILNAELNIVSNLF